MIISPEVFIGMTKEKKGNRLFKIGTIPADYASGKPTIKFDGESAAGIKTYPYLSSYTPTASDRVLVAMVGKGGVILGKIMD